MKILETLNKPTSPKPQFSRNDGKPVGKTTDCFKITFHFQFSKATNSVDMQNVVY